MKKPLTFICRQKIKFILHDFLDILQRYCKLVLGTLGKSGCANPKWYYQHVEKICVHFQAKYQLHLHAFLEILEGHANCLFWVLWACLVAHTQNDSINLSKTSLFIYMPKLNFIMYFFFEKLHLKESCNLIGWQHFDPELENQNFARYGIGEETSTTILLSILDYSQEKLMTNFPKNPKNAISGAILGTFDPNLGKNEFFWKKGLSDFRHSNHLPSCPKTNVPFLRKILNWQTDEQT